MEREREREVPEGQRWSHLMIMESSAKTSSSDHNNPFISTAHLLPNSTATYRHHRLPHSDTAAAAYTFNLNNEDDEELMDGRDNSNAETELRGEGEIPKLPLFEKPLTPSDVGKLNRLVIPKQHAETYFPLNGGGGADSGGESGMLLSFEDEVGKPWRFRYSYWNSSQSYVLTKGWSRFVKEKRLDAGDVVVFARHRADTGRLFIGWRRRNSGSGGEDSSNVTHPPAAANGAGGRWNRSFYSGNSYRSHHQIPSSLPHQHDFHIHAAGSARQGQTGSVSGNSKRLRLFGVNLECLAADESEPRSSQGRAQQNPYQEYYSNHMDMTTSFSGAEDAYRHQG